MQEFAAGKFHFEPSLSGLLFDHLVGGDEQLVWHSEPEHPGGLVVDNELELARLHHRKIRGFGALEDTNGVDADLTIGIRDIGRRDYTHNTVCNIAYIIRNGQ